MWLGLKVQVMVGCMWEVWKQYATLHRAKKQEVPNLKVGHYNIMAKHGDGQGDHAWNNQVKEKKNYRVPALQGEITKGNILARARAHRLASALPGVKDNAHKGCLLVVEKDKWCLKLTSHCMSLSHEWYLLAPKEAMPNGRGGCLRWKTAFQLAQSTSDWWAFPIQFSCLGYTH